MNRALVATLKRRCPSNGASGNNAINLDQNLPGANKVDNSYYKQLRLNKGILEIDQNLALDSATKNLVSVQATGSNFLTLFNNAMVEMSTIQVLNRNARRDKKILPIYRPTLIFTLKSVFFFDYFVLTITSTF